MRRDTRDAGQQPGSGAVALVWLRPEEGGPMTYIDVPIVPRDPARAYLDRHLWVPKTFVTPDVLQAALVVRGADGAEIPLYVDAQAHVGVPRELWAPSQLLYSIVAVRPQASARTPYALKMTLDFDIYTLAQGPRTIQRDALAAILTSRGGIL